VKLGVLQALPSRLDELSSERLARIGEMGFTGTGLPTSYVPDSITLERARDIGRQFADAGLDLVEYGRYHTTLIHPDPSVRRENIADLAAALRVARVAGCMAVITGAGSHNPGSQWWPHPDNYSRQTFDRLIESLREAVKPAEDEGVLLGLEGSALTPLKNAQTTRDVLDAVGSPALRAHLDPVNWITWDTIFSTGDAVRSMFETLGPERMLSAHNKGIAAENKAGMHISETVTGARDDIFDHAAILRVAAQMPSDFYLVIEHLSLDQMPAARNHLLRIAEQIGVHFDGADGEVE
jgi:sugar phosphate isomerase/epimerase